MDPLYFDPLRPTRAEIEYDNQLEARALKGDKDAAYLLGRREAELSFTTNLDNAGIEVLLAYESGRNWWIASLEYPEKTKC